MSASQRAEARARAYERGRQASIDGKPASANPYKRPVNGGFLHSSGQWSLWPAWESGYQHQNNKNRESR